MAMNYNEHVHINHMISKPLLENESNPFMAMKLKPKFQSFYSTIAVQIRLESPESGQNGNK